MRLSEVVQIFRTYALLGIVILAILLGTYSIIYRYLLRGKKRLSLRNTLIIGGLSCYLFIVMGATLLTSHRSGAISLVPYFRLFSTYLHAWHTASIGDWRNQIMNIIMFIPFGIGIPLLTTKVRKSWKTVGIGFLLSAIIETTQLVTGRGRFTVDDLFNNTLGALLGYCLYQILISIIKKRQLCKVRLTKWLSPWMATIAVFIGAFFTYQAKEFGNLAITPVYSQEMSHTMITSEVIFSTTINQGTIFSTSGKATKKEVMEFAKEFFSHTEAIIDENDINIYDETIIFNAQSKETDQSQRLWVDRLGLTYWYINFDPLSTGNLVGAKEGTLRTKLEELNITIPNDAVFSELGEGNYRFMVTPTDNHEPTYHGDIQISLNDDSTISSVTNHIIPVYPVKSVNLISEQMAFERISEGHFIPHFGSDFSTIHIFNIESDWFMDSKGFFRPIYRFNVKFDGIDSLIMVPAEM